MWKNGSLAHFCVMGLCHDPWLVTQSLLPFSWGKWLIIFNQNKISTADLCNRLLYPANNKPVYPCLTRMPRDATAQLLPGQRHSTGSCCVHLNTSLYVIYLYLSLTHRHTHICRYICTFKCVFSSSMKSVLISETVILCSDCYERCWDLKIWTFILLKESR